jgi:CspA family cold shock protein
MSSMRAGTVKRLVSERGFGFLVDERGSEYFFHRSAVCYGSFEGLHEGSRVTFEEEPSPKGLRAGAVRVV